MFNHAGNTVHVAAWSRHDRNRPAVTADLVIPEPGRVIGAVYRYRHDDGHRSAALATYGRGEWSFVQPLPERPPAPEFEAPIQAARRWLETGP